MRHKQALSVLRVQTYRAQALVRPGYDRISSTGMCIRVLTHDMIDNTIPIIARKLSRTIAPIVTNRRKFSTEEHKVYSPNTMIAMKPASKPMCCRI